MEVLLLDVYDNKNKEIYSPFYFQSFNSSNQVADIVTGNYDKVMQKFVEVRIFKIVK